jgi:hypothetical protein
MKTASIFFFLFTILPLHSQISSTYILGNIPTNLEAFDDNCEGALSILLPSGDDIEVLGINISYSMTAFDENWISDQRSRVRCVNNDMVEPTVSGTINSNGTQIYQRENVTIANGIYPGGTLLQFQMEAFRNYDDGFSSDCDDEPNRVDNGTWTIEVIFDQLVPLVGVNTSSPTQSLSVGGKLSIGDDLKIPSTGTMRYNENTGNFEGWTGTGWKIMNYSPTIYSYEQHPVTDAYSSNIRDNLITLPDSLLIEEPGKYLVLFDMTFFSLFGNSTSLSSDRFVNIHFGVYNTLNFRYIGPNITGLPSGFTYYFRNRETVQMHKVIDIPNPSTYMYIQYEVHSNTCCAPPTSTYSITDIKMSAIKLD